MNKRAARLRPLFLAEGEGFAPLAARPGEQPTGLFSLRPSLLFPYSTRANRSLPLAPPPSNPSLYSFSGNGEQAIARSPFPLAEGEGFEPPEAFTSTVFKTAAFDRSAILPYRPPEKGSRFLLFQSAFSPTPRQCRAFKSSSLAVPRFQALPLNDASRGRRVRAYLRPSAYR